MSLESHGISTAPQHRMSLPELAAQCADEAAADTLFSQLSGYLGSPGASLCIKPATSSWGLGVARWAAPPSPVYHHTIGSFFPSLSAFSLFSCTQQHLLCGYGASGAMLVPCIL